MSAPAKFLFDVDFGGPPKPRNAEPMISIATHQAALAEKEASAYRAGVAAATAEAEKRATGTLQAIASRLERLSGELAQVERRLESEAVEVALAIARKLCPELITQEPLAEISAMVADCFAHLVVAPHVVVRVAESLHAPVRERLEEIARRHGFDGRLIILGEPGIRIGDCRIEWADGGMARDHAAIEATIAEAVGRYVLARRGGTADEVGRTES